MDHYHFYMQHNDGTWSHKPGVYAATNLRLDYDEYTDVSSKYLTNKNIIDCADDDIYDGGELKFFIITKDAVSDYPHKPLNYHDTTAIPLFFTDMAGDNMFTSSSISIGE